MRRPLISFIISLQALALGDTCQLQGLVFDGYTLEVKVSAFDADKKWRHAGGAEDWVVRAPEQ